jgi:hypothetical protein
MDDAPPEEAEEAEAPRDLRAELFQCLSTKFAAALEAAGSLPSAAKEALGGLLDSDAPTAGQIVAAVAKNDPVKQEAGNE